MQNIDAQISVQQAQISANQAQLDRAQAALVFAQQQAARYQDPGERRVWQRSECAAVHLPTASAGGCGGDCTWKTSTWRSGKSRR